MSHLDICLEQKIFKNIFPTLFDIFQPSLAPKHFVFNQPNLKNWAKNISKTHPPGYTKIKTPQPLQD